MKELFVNYVKGLVSLNLQNITYSKEEGGRDKETALHVKTVINKFIPYILIRNLP